MVAKKVARLSPRAQSLLEDFEEATQIFAAEEEAGSGSDDRDRAKRGYEEAKHSLVTFILELEARP